MAKKGEQARASVVETISKAFKDLGMFETVQDKKIYVWANDGPGGERIQYAIAISAPKTPVSAGASVGSNQAAWDNAPQGSPAAVPATPTPVELSEEDRAKVKALMESLGIKN